jgi:hypothetical protein
MIKVILAFLSNLCLVATVLFQETTDDNIPIFQGACRFMSNCCCAVNRNCSMSKYKSSQQPISQIVADDISKP